MTNALTWFECSAKLNAGDKVVFVSPWDIFPENCIVAAGETAIVVENDLNEINQMLRVLPDSMALRETLAKWDGEIHLYPHAGDNPDDAAWRELSPVAMAP